MLVDKGLSASPPMMLKACAFDKTELFISALKKEGGFYYVQCPHCLARGPRATKPMIAVAGWNDRPFESELAYWKKVATGQMARKPQLETADAKAEIDL